MENPQDIRRGLELSREDLENAKHKSKTLSAGQITLQKEIAALQAKIATLRHAEEANKESLWKTRADVMRLEKEVERGERKLDQAEKNAKIVKDLQQRGDILDILTSDAPWRKDALPHQLSGAKQLAIAGRGILGDKRGLGKTLTSLIWLDMVEADKVIIFLPKETASAFRKQMPRWAGHRSVFDLTSKTKLERNTVLGILPMLEQWTIIINVEAWRRDWSLIEKLRGLEADAVVVDEAHAAKDPSSWVFRGIKEVLYPEDSRTYKAPKHLLAITGTPFLNYPDEMGPLLHFVDRLSWPSVKAFREDYLIQGFDGRWRFDKQTGAKDMLFERLGLRFIQRDRKAAGVVIPPQEVVVHDLEFNQELYPRQFKAYQDLEAKSAMIMANMDESKVMGVEGLALLTRLRQMITWPKGIQLKDPETGEVLFRCDIDESVKVDAAVRLIGQLVMMEDERVVVFSQFKSPLHEIGRQLKKLGISAAVLDGSTPQTLRERIKRDFDADQTPDGGPYEWDVVLCNYKVAGQSLDFTGATQMVLVDREWNPGRDEQAHGRIDRMGQTRKTTVHILYTPDTVDTDMQNLLDIKGEEIDAFEATMKAAHSYLSEKAS